MPVFRVEHNKNYTNMSNYHFRDKNLSLKAVGLLSYMLSLPDDWDYSLAGLSKIRKDGIDSIRTALNELEQYGYVTRNGRVRNEDGTLGGSDYIVREKPIEDKPTLENPTQDNPTLDNSMQLNTKRRNTKNKNNLITKQIFNSFVELGFGEDLINAVKEWIIYKKERGQNYKPTGLKQLLEKITESIKEYGEDKVIEVIHFTMSSNYNGITWDRLEKQGRYSYQKQEDQPYRYPTEEELRAQGYNGL